MTLQEIAYLRYQNQHLAAASGKTALQLLRQFAAVQAQEYAQSKWTLGLRISGTNDVTIEKAISSGKILRTHLLRPTWHFVAAQDIRWLLQLTAPRVHAANAFMYRQEKLDTKLLQHCAKIIADVLKKTAKHCTREELATALQQQKIIASGHRLSYIMLYAELEAVICSGARRGNQFTYALLEEYAKPGESFNKSTALAELAKRYYTSRGPATIHDFSTWSGLTITDCKHATQSLSAKLNIAEVEGKEYFWSKTAKPSTTTSNDIQLLPIYDEFIMGYKDRSAIFQQYNALKKKPVLKYDCMIVEAGQVIGTWKRTPAEKKITLFADFFQPLTKAQQTEFENVIEKFQIFDGRKVVLE